MSRVKKFFKKALMPIAIIASLIFLGSAIFSTYVAAVSFAPVKITIDTSVRYQTMEGFGMSAAWTFQDIGRDDEASKELAQRLYGDDGMALDTIRFNIGAGTKEIDNGYGDGETRAAESFFIAENYQSKESFSNPANYDFTRDAAAMNALDKCLETGNVKTVVLFANSPHYLLTANGKGNGTDIYENNLPEENYAAFSDYILIITDFFRQKLSKLQNAPTIYVSPVNEPQWRWGGSEATQEGCHFDPAPLAKFYDTFYTKLKAYNEENGADIKPDFFESGDYRISPFGRTKFKQYIKEFKKYPFFSELEHISVHSYNVDNNVGMKKYFKRYADRNLSSLSVHMSEYCIMRGGLDSSIDTGIQSADVIMKDLTLLSASQWCWWLGASNGMYEDGLVYYTKKDGKIDFFTTKRYYTMSQFTRFISAGDTRIKVKTRDENGLDGMGICAFDKGDGKVVVVLINNREKDREITLPVGFKLIGATVTDADRDLKSVSVENFKMPSKSIATLELEKI